MSKLRECLLVWQSKEVEAEDPLGERWLIDDEDTAVWNVLAFDGVIREAIMGSSTVTSYPIDRGFRISDSSIKNNRVITLDTITSNLSYKVSIRRKNFEDSFTELLSTIGMANKDLEKDSPEARVDKVLDWFGLFDGGDSEYTTAKKHGRAAYDNENMTLTTPFGSVELSNPVVSAVASSVAAQVSHTKVNEVVETVDELSAFGVRVHVISLRGVWKDCAITSFSVSNDKNNAHSAPMSIELTQLTVFETKNKDSLLNSDVRGTREGTEAGVNQERVSQSTSSQPNPSALSYFAAGYHFRGTTVAESGYKQNPVYLPDEPRKPGDKRYYETSYKEIKISTKRDFYLSYKGVDYVFGRVKYNDSLDSFTTSLSWNNGGEHHSVGEFPLKVGVNLVSQYGTNFESLVAVNIERAGEKIKDIKELKLLVIEDYDQYYL